MAAAFGVKSLSPMPTPWAFAATAAVRASASPTACLRKFVFIMLLVLLVYVLVNSKLLLPLWHKFVVMKKEISRLFLNIAQLVIGGIILNSIRAQGINDTNLLIAGSGVAALLIIAGLMFFWLSDKKINNE
jgi:hypothetical protein